MSTAENPSAEFRASFAASGIPVFGITGRAGCGKSTFAAALGRGRGHCRLAFADPLREVSAAIFGSQYRTQEEKTATDAFWSERLGANWSTGRRILQRLGTEIGRQCINQDIWLYAMDRRLMAIMAQVRDGLITRPVVTIEDVRFDNEADFVHEVGGKVIGLSRRDMPMSFDTHASENGVSPALIDMAYSPDSLANLEAIANAHARCAGV